MLGDKQDLSESFKMFLTVKIYHSRSPEETLEIGYRLGRCLRSGDVVGLYGELGAGKTVFVKGIARAFGISERDVTSASFTIITQYRTFPPLTHIDLYRIENSEEMDNIGISEEIGGDTVTVIEWAEKAAEYLPEGAIAVRLRMREEGVREIMVEGFDEEDRRRIQGRTP